MKTFSRHLHMATVTLITCISFIVCPSAFASTQYNAEEEKATRIRQLAQANPDASEDEISAAAIEIAAREGISVNDALETASNEAVTAIDSAGPTPSSSSSSGTSSRFTLGVGKNTGDIFYTQASTSGFNHGHVGIYDTTSTIIEAPGLNQKSHKIQASAVRVSKGAVKQLVRTKQYLRDAAAANARHYLGRDYNSVFFNNKNQNGKMNCSQLVWAAYYYGPGIDLDSNGGLGVYPTDIRDSPRTQTYQIF